LLFMGVWVVRRTAAISHQCYFFAGSGAAPHNYVLTK
jgi:hypothetical protein